MKARITAVLAVAVVALSIAATASAGNGTVKPWDYTRPSGSKTWTVAPVAIKAWTVRGWNIKGWAVRPNPMGMRGVASSVKGW